MVELKRAANRERKYFVFPHKLASGEIRTIETYASVLHRGEPDVVLSIIHDISDRIVAEEMVKEKTEELETALSQKDDLMRELLHRTKNNMMMIASLLALQSDTTEDPVVQDLFAEAEMRIQAMVGIQELLYRAKFLKRYPWMSIFPILRRR